MGEEKVIAVLTHLPSDKQWKSNPFKAEDIEEIMNGKTNTFKAADCFVIIPDKIIQKSIMELYEESYFELGKQKNPEE